MILTLPDVDVIESFFDNWLKGYAVEVTDSDGDKHNVVVDGCGRDGEWPTLIGRGYDFENGEALANEFWVRFEDITHIEIF